MSLSTFSLVKPKQQPILRFLKQLLIAAIAAIAFWTILLMLFEEKFIFFPSSYPGGYYDEAGTVPGIEDCSFITEDGVKIHAWFVKSDSAVATLLMAHGNAGNLSHRLPIIKAMRDSGFNVLMFDYRGYGKSEGSPTEDGVYADGRAAFDYLLQRQGVDSSSIILFGTSLGGAVAVDIATHRKAAGLILESTFSTAKDVARVAYPFLPAQFILRSRFDSEAKIRTIRIPILFLHGDQDGVIPIALGRKLYSAANEPKTFHTIVGADHNDTFWVGGEEYMRTIRSFALSLTSKK
ncbi:MAG: alpha/beta hydrolase [Ignavibacteriae bacterium]|nr:alpha/beta hydrolase [Ignavibacteriota bacterium]